MESSDFIKIEYRLDDTGGWILAQTNGYLPGTGSRVLLYSEQFGLSGTSLQLKVTINVDASNETPWVDNMKVYGTAIPAPTAYAVSADNEALCSGDVAIITVADSETGVNYQLKKNGANEGTAIAGTGSAIEFTGITTAGTYTVEATGSCATLTMSGSVTITTIAAPIAYDLSSNGLDLCLFDNITINVITSEDGVVYKLLLGGSPVSGQEITGTGNLISFNAVNTAGTYTVQATRGICTPVDMNGSIVITTNNTTPTASFTSSTNNQVVTFTNTSSNATSYSWDFGDGSSASTDINPSHTYATTGTYTVTLTASNNCGTDTYATDITITGPSSLFYVDAGGSDSNDGLTTATAFATLAKAIEMTTNNLGTTINIAAGTYTEKDITISKNDITITGAGSASTIFDGDADGRFLIIDANNIVLNNLTLKEYGYLGELTSSGSVIYLTSGTGVIFNEIVFDSNVSTTGSGGPYVYGGTIYISNGVNVTINSSIFKNNTFGNENNASVYYNGGVFYNDSGGTLQVNNSLFYDNTTSGKGSALYSVSGSQATFTNCTLEGNTSWGSNYGVSDTYGNDTFINSIIWNTRYQNSAGYDIVDVDATNVVYGSGYLNDLSGNNSTDDPLFNDVSSFDYTTQYNSFAVDGGDSLYAPADDINKLSRPQGQADDIGAYEHQNTWNGSQSTNWNTAANWTESVVPVSGRSPIIAPTSNNPIINGNDGSSNDGNVVLDNITIKSSAALTIEKDGSLNIAKDFNNQGAVTLNSSSTEFASMIVGGTSSGNITYNKYVNYVGSDEWDLVGSPVVNQSISGFVTTNDDPLAVDTTSNPTYYALGTHDAATNNFTNYTGATVGSAGNFIPAKGYQMATDYGATMAFTGEVATTTQSVTIQKQAVMWNLVANPFPSYIKGNIAADATHNFLKVNADAGIINGGDYLAAYGWKADGSGYVAYNYGTGSTGLGSELLIAPGQGFFVAANSTSPQALIFTPQMRTTAGGDDFINGAPILLYYNFDLKLFHGNSEKAETKYFFQEGLTLGLDPGYDAGAFDQLTPLSSRLPEADTGVNFQINAMSLESAYNQSVPLVINQQEGQSFRISISKNTLPEDINVYLEDVLNGTLTPLKEQDFELSAQDNLSDDGRFYLHFTTQSLAIDEVLNPNNINVYKLNTEAYITINGLAPEMGKTTATLYNMLGMKVRQKELNTSQDTQHISTQGLAGGVYIIKLNAGDVSFSKKVIIQ